MNSQLYAHLEAYDTYGDGNGDTDDCSSSLENLASAGDDKCGDVNDETGDCSSSRDNLTNTGGFNTTADNVELCENKTDKEEKVALLRENTIMYFPIVVSSLISLWREESMAFLPTATISFIWLFLWQRQQAKGKDSSKSHQKHSLQLTPGQQIKRENPTQDNIPSRSSLQSDISKKMLKQEIYDCRKELSRLLGLIGAPPLSGQNNVNDQHGENVGDNTVDIPGSRTTAVDAEDCVAAATSSVVSFLEAHVQLILTIDKALYWVKVSSSLHWGLGPHSQCVERVERAAMSRELFHARRRSADRKENRTNGMGGEINVAAETPISATSVREKQAQMNQPQNRIDTSSILALSSARRNIAHVIVNEANSIVNTLRIIDNHVARQRLPDGCGDRIGGFDDEEVNDCTQSNEDYYEHAFENELLELPDVIDIAWIKTSRKCLANLLTYTVEKVSAWDSLTTLSSPAENKDEVSLLPLARPLQTLHESMWSARNLREYLTSHLLLDDQPSTSSASRLGSVSPIISSGRVDSDREFILPLIEYQKQLDALNAALWSFHHHIYSQSVDPTKSSISGAPTMEHDETISLQKEYRHSRNHQNQTMDFRNSPSKMTWWNQVKEISAACQTLEQEIENRFFSSPEDDRSVDETNDSSDERNAPLSGESYNATETQNYEHIEGDKSSNNEQHKNPILKTTKTLVFSGEGSKEKRPRNKMKQKLIVDDETSKFQSEGRSTAVPLPSARDAFTEQLLVRELQNRIRSVAALREEEQVNRSRIELEGTCGEGEDQSSRNTMAADKTMDDGVHAYPGETMLPGNTTRVEAKETYGRKRAVTTNIFLGASGSLLDELKRNIGPPDQIIDNH